MVARRPHGDFSAPTVPSGVLQCYKLMSGLVVAVRVAADCSAPRAKNFQALADVPLYEPCTQSIWSSGVNWDLEHLRGCILGRSFSLSLGHFVRLYSELARP